MADAVSIRPDSSRSAVTREWVTEAPIALEFNGLAYAVMMATPADLEDFATGFAITEGLAANSGEVTDLALARVELGWIVRAQPICPASSAQAARWAAPVRAFSGW